MCRSDFVKSSFQGKWPLFKTTFWGLKSLSFVEKSGVRRDCGLSSSSRFIRPKPHIRYVRPVQYVEGPVKYVKKKKLCVSEL